MGLFPYWNYSSYCVLKIGIAWYVSINGTIYCPSPPSAKQRDHNGGLTWILNQHLLCMSFSPILTPTALSFVGLGLVPFIVSDKVIIWALSKYRGLSLIISPAQLFYLNLPPEQINLNCTFSKPLSLRANLAGILKWLSWIFCTCLAPSTVTYYIVFSFCGSMLMIVSRSHIVLLTLRKKCEVCICSHKGKRKAKWQVHSSFRKGSMHSVYCGLL